MTDIHLLGTVVAAMAVVNVICAWMMRKTTQRLRARTDALKQVADIVNSNIASLHSHTVNLDARITSIEDEFPLRTIDAVKQAETRGILRRTI